MRGDSLPRCDTLCQSCQKNQIIIFLCPQISDFGLAVKMNMNETHISGAHDGTLTHMAPEVLLEGKQSKSADVYAFGLVMWEIYTGGRVFSDVPNMLLGHQIIHDGRRPTFAVGVPAEYANLAKQCWDADPLKRCDMTGYLFYMLCTADVVCALYCLLTQ